MQKLLSLIIVALVLYNIVKLKISSNEENTTIVEQASVNSSATNENQVSISNDPPVSLKGNLFERTISKIVINALKTEEGRTFFENILQPLNKPIDTKNYSIPVHKDLITSLFKINTIGNGNVGPASCGHVVTVFYQISDMSNNLISEDTKTFTIGSGAVMPGLDNVIVGMNVGQAREAIIPPKYAAGLGANNYNTDSAYRVNVMLKSILPHNFINSNEVKIFDNEIAYRVPLLCGEKVAFNAKIIRLANGEVLYDSKAKGQKVDMKIGDITYPLIFSYALQGKVPVGTRTVIAKGRTFKALGSNINKIISQESLPLNEYLMLELNDFK